MLLCKHLIADTEVIGIGPLMMQYPDDIMIAQAYNRKRLFFELHLKNHTTKIESEWCDLGFGSDPDAAASNARKIYEEFKADYNDAKKKIEELIGAAV